VTREADWSERGSLKKEGNKKDRTCTSTRKKKRIEIKRRALLHDEGGILEMSISHQLGQNKKSTTRLRKDESKLF